jgi:hypothetical protein
MSYGDISERVEEGIICKLDHGRGSVCRVSGHLGRWVIIIIYVLQPVHFPVFTACFAITNQNRLKLLLERVSLAILAFHCIQLSFFAHS